LKKAGGGGVLGGKKSNRLKDKKLEPQGEKVPMGDKIVLGGGGRGDPKKRNLCLSTGGGEFDKQKGVPRNW